jgi:hypothetical protein
LHRGRGCGPERSGCARVRREFRAGRDVEGVGLDGIGLVGAGVDRDSSDGVSLLESGVPETRRWTVESMGDSPG